MIVEPRAFRGGQFWVPGVIWARIVITTAPTPPAPVVVADRYMTWLSRDPKW